MDAFTIKGSHPVMEKILSIAQKVAVTDSTVLIMGESGTGKELVARLLHFRGPRRDAPLLCTDCAQIAETPWGDKLFGEYRRTADAQGLPPALSYLDLARGGTIVLKNVDSLPRAIQERLALFLQHLLAQLPVGLCLGSSRCLGKQVAGSPTLL